MKVKIESEVAQSYPTLNDPKDCNLPGSSIHGIFQARVLLSHKKNEILPFVATWINPESIILSEVSQTKTKNMIPLQGGI